MQNAVLGTACTMALACRGCVLCHRCIQKGSRTWLYPETQAATPSATLHLSHALLLELLQVSVELVDWSQLTMGRRLGRGAEGVVYEARYQDAPIALKESPSMNEIEMYLTAGVHDNVVGLRGLCQKVIIEA